MRLSLQEGPRSSGVGDRFFLLGEGFKPVPSLWGQGLDQRGRGHQHSSQGNQDGQSWDLSGGINLEQDLRGPGVGASAGGEFTLPAELWATGLAQRAHERRAPQQPGGQAWKPHEGRVKCEAYASHFHFPCSAEGGRAGTWPVHPGRSETPPPWSPETAGDEQ